MKSNIPTNINPFNQTYFNNNAYQLGNNLIQTKIILPTLYNFNIQ